MAAFTAAVTSIPGVVAPVVAARIELMLTAESVDEVAELRVEDVLIMGYLLSEKRHRERSKPSPLPGPGGANIAHGEMRERWAPMGSTSCLSSIYALDYRTSF